MGLRRANHNHSTIENSPPQMPVIAPYGSLLPRLHQAIAIALFATLTLLTASAFAQETTNQDSANQSSDSRNRDGEVTVSSSFTSDKYGGEIYIDTSRINRFQGCEYEAKAFRDRHDPAPDSCLIFSRDCRVARIRSECDFPVIITDVACFNNPPSSTTLCQWVLYPRSPELDIELVNPNGRYITELEYRWSSDRYQGTFYLVTDFDYENKYAPTSCSSLGNTPSGAASNLLILLIGITLVPLSSRLRRRRKEIV